MSADPKTTDLVASALHEIERQAAEIERLRVQRDRLVKRLRDAGLSTPFEALNGDEQMDGMKP